MLIISDTNNKKIPYHEKVIQNVKTKICQIDPKLFTFDWIISGSLAVNLLYCPSKTNNDIDLYFSSEEDYKECLSFLKEKYQDFYETEFAVTFSCVNLQLVKKFFLPPEKLIYSHDFVNVSVAITKKCIYTTKETHFSWYDQELRLRNFQIPEDPPPTDYEKVYTLNLLIGRVQKYLHRYELSISSSFKKFLYQQRDFLKSIDKEKFNNSQPIMLNYYGGVIDYKIHIDSAYGNINELLNYDNQNITEGILF